MVEEDADRQVGVPDAAGVQNDLRGEQRISAELEKVVIGSGKINVQHVGPDSCQLLGDGVLGQNVIPLAISRS